MLFEFFKPGSLHENRLMKFAFGGTGRFDMRRETPDAPDFLTRNSGPNETNITFEQFKTNIARTLQNYYASVMGRKAESMDRLNAGRARKGLPPLESAPFSLDLATEMSDFDKTVEQVAQHVFSVPENQLGAVSYPLAVQTAFRMFWDIVQDHPDFAWDHPLFKTQQWRDGTRVPGAYWEGRLVRMSSALDPRNTRQRTGEGDRLRRLPPDRQRVHHSVPLKYRDSAVNVTNAQWSTAPHFNPDRLIWHNVQKGDDEHGFAHKIEVHMPAGKMVDGEPLAGEEPRTGVVVIVGDADDPTKAESVFVDYTEVDNMMETFRNDPYFAALVREKGYLSDTMFDATQDLLEQDPVNRDWKFYSQDVVVALMQKAPEMAKIVSAMEAAGVAPDDFADLKDMTIGARMRADLGAQFNASGLTDEAMKTAFASLASEYRKANGLTWWDDLKAELGM